MLLLSLLACPPEKTTDDTAGDDTAGGDTAAEHTAAPGPAEAWSLVDACGVTRLELTDGSYHLAIRFDANMYDAIVAGTEFDHSTTGVDLVATEGAFIGADVCSSAEEWPTVSDTEAWWSGSVGTVTVHFTPDQAWPDEATWDGTELGDIDVTATGLTLEPAGLGVGTFVVPDITVSGRFAKLDLPA